MDSVAVAVPLRPPTKKMKKRKELDALAPPRAISRRSSSGKRSSQELLTDSSDERSADYWNVSTRGVRCKPIRDRPRPACRGLLKACSVFLGGILVLVTVILIWLFMDVRQQLTALRKELDQVIAGSEGVPDALQTCHTLEKSFRSNVSHITLEMQNLNGSINNFSGQILSLQQELKKVQNSLKSAPELTQLPSTVNDLQSSIAQLTFDINDLRNSYNSLKNSTSTLERLQDKQRQSLSMFENSLSGLSNKTEKRPEAVPISNETLMETKKLWDAVAELSNNLTHINKTLTTNISWAQDDFKKDHKIVVSLQDMAQNASAQIQTLQQECIKKKDYDVLQSLLRSLQDKVSKVSIGPSILEAPKEIKKMYNVSSSSSDKVMMASSNQESIVEAPKKAVTDSTVKASEIPKSSPVSPSPTM